MILVLDTGVLSMVALPHAQGNCALWIRRHVASGTVVVIPEIADYEVRRELVRLGKTESVEALDALKEVFRYLPITTEAMLRAADLWAEIRNRGRPTAPDLALDADVILAAQTQLIEANPPPVVATTNTKHLDLMVKAAQWEAIPPS